MGVREGSGGGEGGEGDVEEGELDAVGLDVLDEAGERNAGCGREPSIRSRSSSSCSL